MKNSHHDKLKKKVQEVIDKLNRRAEAIGMTELIRQSGLAKQTVYRTLGAEGNPRLSTLLTLCAVLDCDLDVKMARNT